MPSDRVFAIVAPSTAPIGRVAASPSASTQARVSHGPDATSSSPSNRNADGTSTSSNVATTSAAFPRAAPTR